jgi:hypothetical protein
VRGSGPTVAEPALWDTSVPLLPGATCSSWNNPGVSYEPITDDGPGLETVFGPLANDVENRVRGSVVLLGRRVGEIAGRKLGHTSQADNSFVLKGESSGSKSIEFRFGVAVPGRGEVSWAVTLIPIAAVQEGRPVNSWEIFITVDVAVEPPTGDGEPRAVFNQRFSAPSPDQAITKLGDAVRKLDLLMVRPASDWIARGEVAGA